MPIYLRTSVGASAIFAIAVLAGPVRAGSDPAAQGAVQHLQLEWERIKFAIPEGSDQTAAMNALGDEPDAIGAKYPDDVPAQIWDGIILAAI